MRSVPTTMTPAALALLLLAVLSGAARAEEPRVIADCEKIQAADAYNQCLAKFGPESKVKSLEPERPGDVKASGAEAAASAGPVKHGSRVARGRHGGRRSTAGRGGRKRASFTVSRRRHK